ncbi:aspartyl protease family protein [bacterium]|nr:aspartyl protease family protein [bacterium]
MKRKTKITLVAVVFLSVILIVWKIGFFKPDPIVPQSGVTIPFEMINNHILFKAKVNNSRELSFILDTGNKYTLIEVETAKELGLSFRGDVQVKGAGSQISTGYFVSDASMIIPGYDTYAEPVTLAIQLKHLAASFGHDFDGLVGTEFIKQFAVEIDFKNLTMILHDKNTFAYAGKGDAIPVRLNGAGHIQMDAEISLSNEPASRGPFLIDMGSSGALLFNSPFVNDRQLLNGSIPTIRAIGKVGAGGASVGQMGRISKLQLGNFVISNPVTLFSQDQAGAHANPSEYGSIGMQIMNRFNIVIDLKHDRLYLEPNATFIDSFASAFCGGLSITAEGKDYHTFRINDVLENSPAYSSGIQKNDLIESIDEKPASFYTLTELRRVLEKTTPHKLTISREHRTTDVILIPRKMI